MGDVCFNPVYREANQTKKKHRIFFGSAGSGKSVNIAQDYVIKLSDPKFKGANLLCVRKVEESNRGSTYSELIGAIRSIWGARYEAFWKITQNPLMIESRATGNQIVFRGMKDDSQREKIKSITFPTGKLTWIWMEEATELVQADVEILEDRLRGELSNPNLYYQMTYSFNPVSAQHWIKKKYFDRVRPDVFIVHSTYKDNLYVGQDFYDRMEQRKIDDPEGYRVYGLGEWGNEGGQILHNFVVEDFDISPARFDFMVNAQDFGFNHANALLEIGFKDGEMYVCRELYLFQKTPAEIMEMAKAAGFRKHIKMWCDSANPDKIEMWRRAGYSAAGVNKGGSAGSVKAQIDYLKQMKKIHIHVDCENTYNEATQWRYKPDEHNPGHFLEDPIPVMDDAMAALRYSIEDIRRITKVKSRRKKPKCF